MPYLCPGKPVDVHRIGFTEAPNITEILRAHEEETYRPQKW